MKRILRYEIPIDDQWHQIDVDTHLIGDYPVASRVLDSVDVWLPVVDGSHTKPSWWRIYGTGQPIPEADMNWAGTALSPAIPERVLDDGGVIQATQSGELVWHAIYTFIDPTGADHVQRG